MRVIAIMIMLLASTATFAQPEMAEVPPEHPMGQMPSGELNGELYVEDSAGHKTPVPQHPLSLVVFQNGESVLKLDKVTDENGNFKFKNIFKDPMFAYAVATEYEGSMYVVRRMQLPENEAALTVSFRVGEGSPYLMATPPPQAGGGGGPMQTRGAPPSMQMEAEVPHDHPPSDAVEAVQVPQESFRKVALGLCAAVVLVALYYGFSSSKTRKG